MSGLVRGMGKYIANTGMGQFANVQKNDKSHFFLNIICGLLLGCCLAVSIQLMAKDKFSTDEMYGWNITSAVFFGLSSLILTSWLVYLWMGDA